VVTRKDVAIAAGVSEATVSRVLNSVGPMREKTKLRVLRMMKELNYYPNVLAQNFARRKSGNLGVILPNMPKVRLFSTYYFSEILSGIGAAAQQMGYDLLLLFRSASEPHDYASLFYSQKIDACIILGAIETPEVIKSLRRLAVEKLPFCLVNQHFDHEHFNEVDTDHVKGSYEAANHLISHGFRKIAFLNGPLQFSNSRDRMAGYRLALDEAGIAYSPELVFTGNYSRTSGVQAAQAVYNQRHKIDAVFAANDRMAIGLMQGLKPLGIQIGVDMALIGYDDSDAASLSDLPLSTVRVPFYEMGTIAAEKLLQQVNGKEEQDYFQEKLAAHLVIRESSLCLRSKFR